MITERRRRIPRSADGRHRRRRHRVGVVTTEMASKPRSPSLMALKMAMRSAQTVSRSSVFDVATAEDSAGSSTNGGADAKVE